ncbi:hypothetical protein ACFOY2_16095 [Nonomuraea purpurea]|uniref:Uncharacterized protein n=1 Tax=Nonomuraea purpurea TaxID=1849276 RepID=A0ABV8G7F6_9ACTN
MAKQLQEVQAEREELLIAEQDRAAAEAAAAVALTPAWVAGRAVLLIPHRRMTKLADRGWLRKRGDGRFTARSW